MTAAKNSTADVRILLAGGTYELKKPHAVLSGGSKVTGWTLTDPAKNIWSADVRVGSRSRQLYVPGDYVAYNLIHDTKQAMHDGGSIYTLSSSPGPRGLGYNNQVVDNTQITDGVFPPEARKVMTEAGARR